MEKIEKFDWENDAREKQKQEIASIKGRELVLRLSDQDVEEIIAAITKISEAARA